MSKHARANIDASVFAHTRDEVVIRAAMARRGGDDIRQTTPNHPAAGWVWIIHDPVQVPVERDGVRSTGWYVQQYLEARP